MPVTCLAAKLNITRAEESHLSQVSQVVSSILTVAAKLRNVAQWQSRLNNIVVFTLCLGC